MSTAEGKFSPKLVARSSAPNLSLEPVVAELISLDDIPNSSNASDRTQGSTDSLVSFLRGYINEWFCGLN